MLGHKQATATVAVKDIEAAGRFYEGTLGLQVTATEGDEVRTYRTGASTLLVYESQYAGTNKATAVTWTVGDELEKIVGALQAKGVTFEHYDMPDTTRKGEVHVSGDMKVAWFKDPDGNILSLVNG
ncbi:MAG: VOC family protein [Gemmatimonadota bacterium]|nr:VOC family protein [Gemmatimonadota bacterium]